MGVADDMGNSPPPPAGEGLPKPQDGPRKRQKVSSVAFCCVPDCSEGNKCGKPTRKDHTKYYDGIRHQAQKALGKDQDPVQMELFQDACKTPAVLGQRIVVPWSKEDIVGIHQHTSNASSKVTKTKSAQRCKTIQ